MNILLVVGSARNGSYNQMVANYIIDKYKSDFDIKQADISDLPLYNMDIERDKIDSVEKAVDDVKWADGVIFITPEHNSSIPALLKNFIDWMSRKGGVFIDKPIMITGASTGYFGTYKAQATLRLIMMTKGLEALIVRKLDSYLPKIDEKVEDRKLKEEYAKSLNRCIAGFTDYIRENIK